MRLALPFILVLPLSCFGGPNIDFAEFNDELTSAEWMGSKEFYDVLLERKIDVCHFVKEANTKYANSNLALTRILLVLKVSKCNPEKEVIAKARLDHKDVEVAAAAVEVVGSLTPEKRKDFSATIKRMRANTKNKVILTAISELPRDI
jgi:hypothetical protein